MCCESLWSVFTLYLLFIELIVFSAFLLHGAEHSELQETDQTRISRFKEPLYCLHHKHKNNSKDRQVGLAANMNHQ